jgi:hypothetical protein
MFSTHLYPLNRTHPHIIHLRNCDPELSVVQIIETCLEFENPARSKNAISVPRLRLLLAILFALQHDEQYHCIIQINGCSLANAEVR